MSESTADVPIRTIRGVLRFPGAEPGWALRVTAQVLDVGKADAPAEVVAETVLHECHLADGMIVEVPVPADIASVPGARILHVEIDVPDSEDAASGDYVTAQAYPVLGEGQGDTVEVTLISV